MSKRIFISQPMKGIPESEILDWRIAANKVLHQYYRGEEIEIIDNFNHKNVPENATPAWYLARDLQLLEGADAVIFLPGWLKSHGCCVEYTFAKEYGIPIINQTIRCRAGGDILRDVTKVFDGEIRKEK